MEDNVRKLWDFLLDDYKELAAEAIAAEFGVKPLYVKQGWIYRGNTPESKKPRVIEILHNTGVQQRRFTEAESKAITQ